MNMEQIIQSVVSTLVPVLPYLVKGVKIAGEKTAETIGEKSGELSMKKAQKIWKILQRRTGKPADKVKQSAIELAQNTTDSDWQAMLKSGLRQLLKDDPTLLKDLGEILESDAGQQILRAEDNVNAEIEQEITGSGVQKATLKGNTNIKVHQSKK